MAARGGMTRLALLYSLMEQMRSVERRVAAGAVDEAVCAAAIATAVRQGQVSAGRAALAAGDRAEWAIAETTRDVLEGRIARLSELRELREQRLAAAVAEHHESHVRTEQMERLLARARVGLALSEGRREQAAADDRYGSRLAWSRVKRC